MESAHATEFSSSAMRRIKAFLCLLVAVMLALLLAQMAQRVNSVVAVYMAVVSAAIVVLLIGMARAFRVGIYLVRDNVVVRTTFSTRSWSLGQLERVESMDMVSRGGSMGIFAFPAQRAEERILIVPVFRPVGRRPVVVRGLRISTRTLHDANWLDDALHEVNRAIDEHRAAGGAGPERPTPS